MAVLRERPYSRFNFEVDIGGGDTAALEAGFSEVEGLGLEVEVIEYRAGNAMTNLPVKISGLAKVPDITLKRGVIGSLGFYEWIDQARAGHPDAARDVTIQLKSEDRQTIAMTWKLVRARPTAYRGPELSAMTNDVAIEELVLSCEDLVAE